LLNGRHSGRVGNGNGQGEGENSRTNGLTQARCHRGAS
jgi:hypothetical protein